MIAASASNRSVMFIDSSGTHVDVDGAGPLRLPGQFSATQTSEPERDERQRVERHPSPPVHEHRRQRGGDRVGEQDGEHGTPICLVGVSAGSRALVDLQFTDACPGYCRGRGRTRGCCGRRRADRTDAGLRTRAGRRQGRGCSKSAPIRPTSPGHSPCMPAPWNCSTRGGWPTSCCRAGCRSTRSPRRRARRWTCAKLHSRYPMVLIVPQSGTERVLRGPRDELGVEIVRGAEVVGLTQDGDGSPSTSRDGDTRARRLRGGLRRRAQRGATAGRHRLRRQAIRDAHPAGRRPARRAARRDACSPDERRGRRCSSSRSATAGSGPSPGTGCASRRRCPSRSRWTRSAARSAGSPARTSA